MYEVPVRWRYSDGRVKDLGSLEVAFYAPVREELEQSPWAEPVKAVNVTADGAEESETFIAVTPGNDQRVAVGVNGGGGYSAWISTNGGTSFTERAVPTTADVPGATPPTPASTSAATRCSPPTPPATSGTAVCSLNARPAASS